MKDTTILLKALADENRLRLLMALRNRELCVCQLVEMLKLSPPSVSKHLAMLKRADLVLSRKEGRWIYYRLPDDEASDKLKRTMTWLQLQLSGNKQVIRDIMSLRKILEEEPEALTRRQAGRQAGNS